MTRRGLAELIAIVAPPSCIACRESLPRADAGLCADCARRLPWLRGARCPRCALPGHRDASCPAVAAAFSRAWAPMAYESVAADLVRALKFKAALPAAAVMARQIAATLPRDVSGALVVPVPPQPTRRRRRGFDSAALIAGKLAVRLGLPCESALRRRDRGARQTLAGRSDRRASALRVEPAFRTKGEVLLVDDVHTTGTTLDVCARTLREAGAHVVVALTYARTLEHKAADAGAPGR